MENIINYLKALKKLNVLVIGESIIDEYVFVNPKGRASKDPILSTQYVKSEKYAGGILAVARHIADFVNKVQVVTLLGEYKRNESFIRRHLPKNVKLKVFTKKKSPTIIKRRFLDYAHYQKLFKVEFINDQPINNKLSEEIINYLKRIIKKYDLVLVIDYGHGFINKKIRELIINKSNFLAINVQTNSANFGFNPITKYKKADFLTTNMTELRILYHNNEEGIKSLLSKLIESKKYKRILLTLSKEGCIYYYTKWNYGKAFITEPVDTIGAGDAVFAITSLFVYSKLPEEIVPFIANVVGAISVQRLGNKKPITKIEFLKFMEEHKNEMGRIQRKDQESFGHF